MPRSLRNTTGTTGTQILLGHTLFYWDTHSQDCVVGGFWFTREGSGIKYYWDTHSSTGTQLEYYEVTVLKQ
jgi:hypothetical protein